MFSIKDIKVKLIFLLYTEQLSLLRIVMRYNYKIEINLLISINEVKIIVTVH